MPRQPTLPALLTLAALCAACGEGPASAPTPLPRQGTAAPAAPPARAKQPLETKLPDAPALVADAARRVLIEAADLAEFPDVRREALVALAAVTDAATVRAAAAKLLAPGDDLGFADSESAAQALEALVRAGDADAEKRAVALARAGLDGDTVWDSFVPMLAAVRGDGAAEARKLLVRLADDPLVYSTVVPELAALREPSAATRLHDIATDPEEDGRVRAAAAVGLLAIGDPRANGALEEIVRATTADLAGFDVIDGFAVEGVAEALPWVRRVGDPIIEAGENCTVEIASTAGAFVDVRGIGKGTNEDLSYLRRLLGKDDGLSDDEVAVALWSLGDDGQSEAAANVLAKYVTGVAGQVFDEELGVRILEAVAVRGGASGRPFGRAVDAAAAVPIPDDPKRPDAAARAWRLRIAAARAFLAAKK
jgi:hypothetical protein